MARSQETFNKKEVRSKKEKKRKEKEQRREARKDSEKSGKLEDMLAYVDEFGNITDTPPDPRKKKEVKLEHIEISTPKQEDLEKADPVRKGMVTFFNHDKGFGFIRDSETQESIFVHINNSLDDLAERNLVSFEIAMGPKGPTAVQVKVLK